MKTSDLRALVDRSRTSPNWVIRWRLRRKLTRTLLRVIDPLLDELERLRSDLALADEKARRGAASAWAKAFLVGQNYANARRRNPKLKEPRNPHL